MGDAGPGAPGGIVKRSVTIAGHPTSVSLEAAFWDALKELAAAGDVSVNHLITRIDTAAGDGRGGNLSSAIRVYVLRQYREATRFGAGGGIKKRGP